MKEDDKRKTCSTHVTYERFPCENFRYQTSWEIKNRWMDNIKMSLK